MDIARHRQPYLALALAGALLPGILMAPGTAMATEPSVTVDSPNTHAQEGTLAQATGTYSDPDGDVVTLSASEGYIEKSSGTSVGTWRWTKPEPDGPRSATITIIASDGSSSPVSVDFDLVVENRPPYASVAGPAFVPSRSLSSRYFSWSAGDVPGDTVATEISCGSGTEVGRGSTIISGEMYLECAFTTEGQTSVTVRATDEDGDRTERTAETIATPQVESVADGGLVITGGQGTQNMGGVLAFVDMNIDGYEDLIIGDRPMDTSPPQAGSGHVSVVLGGTDASLLDLGSLSASAGFQISGSVDGQFGRTLASAGDVNGDGHEDLIIGARTSSPFGRAYAGAAFVVYASTSTADLDVVSLSPSQGFMIAGAVAGDAAGVAVAGVGDVDGDGFDDVAIGSPNFDHADTRRLGSVDVIRGAASRGTVDLLGLTTPTGFSIIGPPYLPVGKAVAGGDIDGDGRSDVIVASSSGVARVWAIYGSTTPADVDTSSIPASAGFSITGGGAGPNSRFGSVLASGDVDGDGYADTVIGAPGWSDGTTATYGTGAVYIVRGQQVNADVTSVGEGGGPRVYRYRGERSDDAVGTAIAVGDRDGDSRADLAIGSAASNNGPLAGSAYLVTGTSSLQNIDLGRLADGWQRIDGDAIDDMAGGAVAIGDFIGDGQGDVAVGAPNRLLGMPGRIAIFRSEPVTDPPPTPTPTPTASPTPTPTPTPPPVVDLTPPAGTIATSGGSSHLRTRDLTLGVAAADAGSGVSQLALSNDETAWTVRPYAPIQPWQLTAGDGPRKIYAKWKDGAGNWSAVASLAVILDTVAPTASAPRKKLIARTAVVAGRATIRLSWSGSDATSGIARYDVAQQMDGGAWTAVGSGIATMTLDRALATGHAYRFRVRPLDRAGNVGAWTTGAEFDLTRYQESSARITYSGTWRAATSTGYWGGSARRSSAAGAKASITVTGRSVAWVAAVGPSRGKAAVYVNGNRVATVDLYSATSEARRVVWTANWSTSASRKVTIKVQGTAGRPRIDLDAFVTTN